MFRKIVAKHYDWILVICGVFLVAFIAILLILVYSRNVGNETDEQRFENQKGGSNFYTPEPPDPKYPPPAKEQRGFYTSYNEKPIYYSIDWSVRNRDRNPIIGKHEFTVTLYNSLNKSVNLNEDESKPFTIGCIARDNPYQAIEVQRQSFSFQAYETKKIKFSIDVSCLYLGTADSQYFWRIY